MAINSERLREQGMRAGLVFGSHCPYPEGNDEARQWELGWSEGVLKRIGGNGSYPDEEPPSLWRRLFKLLL